MRTSGVLLHITSLPSPYGIGTMGKAARDFVDFLVEAKQTYWQILPVGPTGYGDSPYQPFSTFAGNPYLIDFDELAKLGYLEKSDYEDLFWGDDSTKVDFGLLYDTRFKVLKIAAKNFLKNPTKEYETFLRENDWLEDYALYMTLKFENDGKPWTEWDKKLKKRDKKAINAALEEKKDDVNFWKVVQYFFFNQWYDLKSYANKNGISIIGDLPIYVAYDSSDVWSHPEYFQLNHWLAPKAVAGCPPDGFSADGQLWGNPLFDWKKIEKEDFAWWVNRIKYQYRIYDVLRIDHFRGFDSYYAIPYPAENARGGKWMPGPGMKLFNQLKKDAGDLQIIAEDLGFLTDSVRQLLKDSEYPGMRVMELGFDSRDTSTSDYIPENFIEKCIAYTGTHDNDTILGWFTSADELDVENATEYLKLDDTKEKNWEMMKSLWKSVADTTIVQGQDLLDLGSEARMNTPSTLGGNWVWRCNEGDFSKELAKRVAAYMKEFNR